MKVKFRKSLFFQRALPFMPLLVLLIACGPEREEEVERIDAYFDVQGLLEETASRLRTLEVRLEKKAEFSGEVEVNTILLDSAALAQELEVFWEVDINKPVLEGRYLERTQMEGGLEVTVYQADNPEELNINYLKIYRQPGSNTIERVEALFSSRNILYNSTRKLMMDYGQVKGELLPLNYEVEGIQNMIFSEKEAYTIKADFQYPGLEK